MLAQTPTRRNRETLSDWQVGFNAYADGAPLSTCATAEQRRGWANARAGEAAAMMVDVVFAAGGSASEADLALEGAW